MSAKPRITTSMLTSYEPWMKEKSLGFWSFLDARADIELAVAFSKLFWPDFVEADGCIFLAERYDPQLVEQWQQQLRGDRAGIEKVVNHVHLYDLFNNSPGSTPDLLFYQYLGQVLLTCWSAALERAFPGRQFEFTYLTEPDEYGPTLSFWQQG